MLSGKECSLQSFPHGGHGKLDSQHSCNTNGPHRVSIGMHILALIRHRGTTATRAHARQRIKAVVAHI